MDKQEWTEIKIKIDVKYAQIASDIAIMSVPYGFYLEDYSDLEQGARDIAHIDLIDEDLIKKDRNTAIIHLYIQPTENPHEAADYFEARLKAENIPYDIDFSEISEEDWANNWKKFFKPTNVGNRLFILPLWENAPDTDRKILKIDPGAAFGTGTHATTKLCLSVIDDAVTGGEKVLDVGCGSGILSIASLLLGAESAVGVDIDSLAVKTARENGVMNGFSEPEYTILQGNLADKVNGKFDICVANIVADVIIRLCENITDFLKPGGLFITSGIIDIRADEVREVLEKTGFTVEKRFDEGGWVAFCARI